MHIHLRGQVGGVWALEFESFLGPVKWLRPDLGPKKLEISRAQPPPTFLSNGYARIQYIVQRAV
jgi:hypothetical protein